MLRPLYDIVIVEPVEKPKEINGILLPPNHKEKIREGIVYAVGPGSMTQDNVCVPLEVEEGDYVYFSDNYRVIEEEGKQVLLMNANNILAKDGD